MLVNSIAFVLVLALVRECVRRGYSRDLQIALVAAVIVELVLHICRG